MRLNKFNKQTFQTKYNKYFFCKGIHIFNFNNIFEYLFRPIEIDCLAQQPIDTRPCQRRKCPGEIHLNFYKFITRTAAIYKAPHLMKGISPRSRLQLCLILRHPPPSSILAIAEVGGCRSMPPRGFRHLGCHMM